MKRAPDGFERNNRIHKVKLKHAETKKEWEKVVTLTKAQGICLRL
jgi:hypothetical protein